MLGEGLVVRDLSEWSVQFPLTEIQWYLSSLLGDDSVFDERPMNEGFEFVLPASALGRYIQIIGTRQVQDVVRRPHTFTYKCLPQITFPAYTKHPS